MLVEVKWCLVRYPSGRWSVTISFQGSAVWAGAVGVPRCHPIQHEGTASALAKPWHRVWAGTPVGCRFGVTPQVILLWASAGGLWDPSPKCHTCHLLQEPLGLCLGCPCMMWVLAARDELQAASPTTEPGLSLLLAWPFPINCRRCQRVSWISFSLALFFAKLHF